MQSTKLINSEIRMLLGHLTQSWCARMHDTKPTINSELCKSISGRYSMLQIRELLTEQESTTC